MAGIYNNSFGLDVILVIAKTAASMWKRWQRSTKLRALSGEQTAVRSALYFALCKLLRNCKAARVTLTSASM